MNIIQNLDLINASELALIALCCYVLTSGIKKTKIKNAYMPFISMAVGILIGIIVALAYHDNDIVKAGLAGFLVGGWTAGLFTGIKATFGGYDLDNDTSSSTKLTEVTPPKYESNVNIRRD
ncbi:phage holin family protein [Companilactobacillus allii]|uniref:Holin n=1 Tax=Companilactobacillus allii TaxID=1847728 RepID=A0A1P8Q4S1_9LACO|nr:hypothetical protein [Companilactobacillus allii]APX72848.1 hypothetical protein BTM29_09930 [Companilactobacillus allii]USQ67636.1 phage holin family protein [Companilactobacillus allii]